MIDSCGTVHKITQKIQLDLLNSGRKFLQAKVSPMIFAGGGQRFPLNLPSEFN